MAKLKLRVKSLDDVDEKHRDFYVEQNGEFVLDADVEDTAGLKTALQKTRDELRQVKGRVKGLPDDMTGEQIAEMLRKIEEQENNSAAHKGDFEKLKEQLVAKHQKELEGVKSKLSSKDGFIQKLLVDNAATTAITEMGGSVRLLLPHVRQHIRVVEDDATGEPVAQVIDSRGTIRIGSSKGDPMSIAELVAEMKGSDEFAPAFRGAGASGSGTPPGGGQQNGTGAGSVSSLSDLKTDADKAAYISKHGFDAYQELVAKAYTPA